MQVIHDILKRLGVGEAARAIYLDLLEHGSSNARTIATRLSMTRPSVYDQLKELGKLALICERDIDGKTEFAILDVGDLERRVTEEREKLESLTREFVALQKQLSQKLAKKEGLEPKIRFFSDKNALWRAMHDMLWDESITLYVVWPYEEMLRVFGEDRLRDFNHKRIKNGVKLKSIWGGSGTPKKGHIWSQDDWGVERRLAPSDAVIRMGYTIYDSKVLFTSSHAESFGFVVQSDDFADLMRLQFDLLWRSSKPQRNKSAARG